MDTIKKDFSACGVTGKDLDKMLVCRGLEDCENGVAESCKALYCDEIMNLQKDFPGSGLESGPTSKLCLSKTKRVRGTNWVEYKRGRRDAKLTENATTYAYIDFKCIDKNEKLLSGGTMYCNSAGTRCQDEDVSLNQKNPDYLPMDALAKKICQAILSQASTTSPRGY